MFGPLYLPIVATTSLSSAAGLGGDDHDSRWFEVHASRLGASFLIGNMAKRHRVITRTLQTILIIMFIRMEVFQPTKILEPATEHKEMVTQLLGQGLLYGILLYLCLVYPQEHHLLFFKLIYL